MASATTKQGSNLVVFHTLIVRLNPQIPIDLSQYVCHFDRKQSRKGFFEVFYLNNLRKIVIVLPFWLGNQGKLLCQS